MLQNKLNLFFLLKTGVGSAIAILIADSLGLAYSTSAGIITLLTLQNTKKETIVIALKRVAAFTLAVVVAYVMFSIFGYTAIAFGGFVILFVALCLLLGLKDGIAMNAVLTTHFLIERNMSLSMIGNETILLFIGMTLGIGLNLIMPRNREQIRKEQLLLEEELKKTLRGIADLLKNKDACLIQPSELSKEVYFDGLMEEEKEYSAIAEIEDTNDKVPKQEFMKNIIKKQRNETSKLIDFNSLEHLLEELLRKAYEDAGNTLLTNTKYMVSYLEMRKLQISVLKEIQDYILRIPVILRQSYPIAEFFEHIAASFHELNNAEGLLRELSDLFQHFRKEALPGTREEFEYRAILFDILKETEYFLVLKRNFIKELETANLKSYWTK